MYLLSGTNKKIICLLAQLHSCQHVLFMWLHGDACMPGEPDPDQSRIHQVIFKRPNIGPSPALTDLPFFLGNFTTNHTLLGRENTSCPESPQCKKRDIQPQLPSPTSCKFKQKLHDNLRLRAPRQSRASLLHSPPTEAPISSQRRPIKTGKKDPG